ncbi:COG4315 family predicted lipoprotein [Kitasatospora sp. McL0602]|uniref:COG4315 family predicted lipoprotein n=1 Tax=Kitasatospora sp. McL0602 TaxID=3439530 RepID=UPI003F8A27CC
MPTFHRAGLLVAAGAAVAALVTGCGSSGSSSGTAATPVSPAAPSAPSTSSTSTAPATPASPSTPAAPVGQTVLKTAASAQLGTIVTDGNGMTLYRFDHDTASPSASNCNGSCAALWPPALVAANQQVQGVDQSQVGSVTRADGSKQLTLAGWPLYRYTPDTKPGDTKGQGFGGIWFAVTPTGQKAAATAAPATPSTTGGYGY